MFLAVDITRVVTVPVPVEYIGEAPAVKAGLGVLNTLVDELEIEVLPTEIPHKIEVDLSTLVNLGDAIYVNDIAKLLPKSAQAILDGEVVICVIAGIREESEEESSSEIDFDSIEAEKKGKKEVEE
jgi:large subunit ribosomal protein L25